MLSVVMLNVVMLSVVTLNALTPILSHLYKIDANIIIILQL